MQHLKRGVYDFSMGIACPERKASQVELMIKTHPGFGCSIPRHPGPPPDKVSYWHLLGGASIVDYRYYP